MTAPSRRHGAHTTRTPESVVVHGDDVRVDRLDAELPHAEVRDRFGGLHPLAVLAGTAAAVGTTAALASLLDTTTRIGWAAGDDTSAVGLVVAALILVAALLLGGWTAGRAARFDGLKAGLLTGLLFVAVTAALGAARTADTDVRELLLPSWLTVEDVDAESLLSALVALLIVLGAAALGGRLGARWHRRVDDVLLGTRAGGLTRGVDHVVDRGVQRTGTERTIDLTDGSDALDDRGTTR